MEKYEQRYQDSHIERYIRDATRKGTLTLEGTNDERGMAYAAAAIDDILSGLRTELRGVARATFRSLENMERRCIKYKTLGATDPVVAGAIQDAYAGALRYLVKEADKFDPRAGWEKALDDG